MRRLLPAALLALSLCACTRDPGPDATYRALARAVSERDADAAWALLSEGSHRWLEGQARRAAAAAPGVVAPSARAMLVGDAALGVRPPAAISVTPGSGGERAVLRVEPAGGGAPSEVLVVREAGRWKVELPLPGPPR